MKILKSDEIVAAVSEMVLYDSIVKAAAAAKNIDCANVFHKKAQLKKWDIIVSVDYYTPAQITKMMEQIFLGGVNVR